MDHKPSIHTTDPVPAVSNQESSEGSSAVTSIHLIYAVGPCEKLVVINVWFSVSLPALNYTRVRTCSPLHKQASCTLHSLRHKWQKPAQEYASVSRMAHTANLNSFHMLPKNCDRMPLTNKWVDCLASTEKGFITQLWATAPLFLGVPGLLQRLSQPNAADCSKCCLLPGSTTAATRFFRLAASRLWKRPVMNTQAGEEGLSIRTVQPPPAPGSRVVTHGTGVFSAQPSSRHYHWVLGCSC